MRTVRLTRFELEVMDALWSLGSASVREIHQQLPESKRPGYTTVQTIIYRLEEKGAVRRVKKVGNAHIFEPLVSRHATHRRLVEEFVDLLGGSGPLMAHLIQSRKLTLEDLREVESMLEAHGRKSAERQRRRR